MRGAAIAVAVAVTSGLAAADPAPPNIEDAIRQATASDKPLVVEFSASWCQPCREFERTTLADPRVKDALAGVVFVRYDAEARPGSDAAERYEVSAYPTFLIVDRAGVARERTTGAPLGEAGVRKFLELVRSARAVLEDEASMLARVRANPKLSVVRIEAARWYVRHERPLESLAHYDAVVADARAPAGLREEARAAATHIRRYTRWKAELTAEKLALVRGDPAHATRDDLAMATIGAGLGERDVNELLARVLAAQTDPDRVNELIYVALAADAKAVALAAANRLISTRRDARHLDTLAECEHANGRDGPALKLEDEALALVQHSPVERQIAANRERFARAGGKSAESAALAARVNDLWKRLGEADGLLEHVDSELDRDEWMKQLEKSRRAEAAESARVSKACAPDAGTTTEAMARLELDANGHPDTAALLLEEGAPAKLGPCLRRELATTVLPLVFGHRHAWLHFYFQRAATSPR